MAPEIWWYIARATGLVAWALAVGSLLLGLALATRAMGPKPKGPWLLDLHRWLGGLAVVFTAAHVGGLIADSYVSFDLVDALVPFAASWRPGRGGVGRPGALADGGHRGHVAADAPAPEAGVAGGPPVQLPAGGGGDAARRHRRHRRRSPGRRLGGPGLDRRRDVLRRLPARAHRRSPPARSPPDPPPRPSAPPLEDAERRRGPRSSSSASASPTRLRARTAARSPTAARSSHSARPSATRSSMPCARSQSACDEVGGRRRQLVDRHLAGDVLRAEVVERRAAPRVAAVGAHPLGPGSLGEIGGGGRVVEGHHPASRPGERRGRRPPRPRPPTGAGCERRPPRRRPTSSVVGSEHLDEIVAVEADVHLGPPGRGPLEEPERQVVEELVGQDDARARQAGQLGQAHHDRARRAEVRPPSGCRRRVRAGWRTPTPAAPAPGARRGARAARPTAPRARTAAPARTAARPPAPRGPACRARHRPRRPGTPRADPPRPTRRRGPGRPRRRTADPPRGW